MKRIMRMLVGILILILGISIFLYPNYREWKLAKEIETITEVVHEIKEKDNSQEPDTEQNNVPCDQTIEETEFPEISENSADGLFRILKEYNTRLLSEGQEISEEWDFRQAPVDVASWNNGSNAVGYVEIPEITLSLPLYIGATEANMSNGAVVLSGTSMPIGGAGSNCVIAAHRGWSGSPYFRDIDKLKIGSEVVIHNLWEKLSYQVSGTSIIHETEADILKIQPDKDIVTLFSCYPYMSLGTDYRLVVFCERVMEEKEETLIMEKGTSVRELVDEELEEKGITFEEPFTEDISQNEDKIRVILPVVCILSALVIAFCHWRMKR